MPIPTNTQNTAHTPGPWHFNGRRITTGAFIVADIWNADEPTGQANAQLISQSPRLLKAALDLWHADAAEGQDRDEMLITSAWAELIDAIEAADGSRP